MKLDSGFQLDFDLDSGSQLLVSCCRGMTGMAGDVSRSGLWVGGEVRSVLMGKIARQIYLHEFILTSTIDAVVHRCRHAMSCIDAVMQCHA